MRRSAHGRARDHPPHAGRVSLVSPASLVSRAANDRRRTLRKTASAACKQCPIGSFASAPFYSRFCLLGCGHVRQGSWHRSRGRPRSMFAHCGAGRAFAAACHKSSRSADRSASNNTRTRCRASTRCRAGTCRCTACRSCAYRDTSRSSACDPTSRSLHRHRRCRLWSKPCRWRARDRRDAHNRLLARLLGAHA